MLLLALRLAFLTSIRAGQELGARELPLLGTILFGAVKGSTASHRDSNMQTRLWNACVPLCAFLSEESFSPPPPGSPNGKNTGNSYRELLQCCKTYL